jgi:UDP-N-acetylglucosamine--N-acetylmuramyl-(pentapeptide) pyrophosphoryl-undecaprenol N-acetylglucosamine transferase
VLLEADSSGQELYRLSCSILHDGARRQAMADAMASLGIRDATERIVETVLEVCRAKK